MIKNGTPESSHTYHTLSLQAEENDKQNRVALLLLFRVAAGGSGSLLYCTLVLIISEI